jgi:hypothetical protein
MTAMIALTIALAVLTVAIGTSLVVIAMKSFAGLAGYLTSVHISWAVAGAVTAAALAGALIGAHLTAMVDPIALRKAFGWFVLAMSSVILGQEIDPAVGVAGAVLTVLAAGIAFACARYAHCPLRRLVSRQAAAASS